MIRVRKEDEVARLRQCGTLNAALHQCLRPYVSTGMSTSEIEEIAKKEMVALGVKSSIFGLSDFPAYICVSINDEVGHGVPNDRVIQSGDVVKIDISVEYEGYHTDCAVTHVNGNASKSIHRLVEGTRKALAAGIASAKSGSKSSDISHAIHKTLTSHRLGVIRHAFGHGIGTELHEPPILPNFGPNGYGPILRSGMVLAIEPVSTLGKPLSMRGSNGFVDKTIDGAASAHFEHTVLITTDEPEVLTFDAQPKTALQDLGGSPSSTLRRMVSREQSELFQLAASVMDPILISAWGRRATVDEIFAEDSVAIVIEDEQKKILGFFVYSMDDSNLHLNTIVIRPEVQGRGVGKYVLQWLEQCALDSQQSSLSLCVQSNNQRAIHLYRKWGFQVTDYPFANTILMKKVLTV